MYLNHDIKRHLVNRSRQNENKMDEQAKKLHRHYDVRKAETTMQKDEFEKCKEGLGENQHKKGAYKGLAPKTMIYVKESHFPLSILSGKPVDQQKSQKHHDRTLTCVLF